MGGKETGEKDYRGDGEEDTPRVQRQSRDWEFGVKKDNLAPWGHIPSGSGQALAQRIGKIDRGEGWNGNCKGARRAVEVASDRDDSIEDQVSKRSTEAGFGRIAGRVA